MLLKLQLCCNTHATYCNVAKTNPNYKKLVSNTRKFCTAVIEAYIKLKRRLRAKVCRAPARYESLSKRSYEKIKLTTTKAIQFIFVTFLKSISFF